MKAAFEAVWRQASAGLVEELVAFWRDNQALGGEEAARLRAQQAVCVARDENGALCGVATAVVKVLPRLRQPTYYYRQFFARRLRGRQQELAFFQFAKFVGQRGLVTNGFQFAKRVLQDYNAGLPAPESLGILLEIENSKIAAAYRRAHEPGFEAGFIGYSPRGLQLRVSWFDDAVLLPPAPLRRPAQAARAPVAGAGRSPSSSPRGNAGR